MPLQGRGRQPDLVAELKMNGAIGRRSDCADYNKACDPGERGHIQTQAPFTAPRNGVCVLSPRLVLS